VDRDGYTVLDSRSEGPKFSSRSHYRPWLAVYAHKCATVSSMDG